MNQNEEIVRDDNIRSRVLVDSSRHKLQTYKDDKMIARMYDEDTSSKKIHDGRKWTVGKVSFMMLLLVSFTDILLNLVDAQMESLEAPDHYDALSADVIRPAFRYHVSGSDRTTRRKRMGLGSAAISSVTNALSPILPFTGGLDLRREDYWKNGLLGSVTSIAEQIKSAFSESPASPLSVELLTTRGGSKVARKVPRSTSRESHSTVLSNSEPFMALTDIARLTLNDVSFAFRYAVESTRFDFHAQKFLSSASSRVKDVLTKMSEATAQSRGNGIGAALTGTNVVAGDVDALFFCAAMRIFAEWRVLRQVPDGYKGYAVGMSLGQKDIVQNVGKIEKAVHEWIEYQSENSSDESHSLPRSSPTLRELLQFEANMGVHDKLPRLKEKSAAMGLLWVRRQLHYQTALFANVIQVPSRFDTARAAISAAYEEVYNSYHGWAVQKIFTYSFQAAPDTSEVYKVMNPEKLKEVTESALNRGSVMSHDTFSHKTDEGNLLEKFSRHIGQEWDKLAGSIGGLFGNQRSPVTKLKMDQGKIGDRRAIDMEAFINEQMKLDAHDHIVTYLEVAKPILDDLATLFDEFNMNDPTKV